MVRVLSAVVVGWVAAFGAMAAEAPAPAEKKNEPQAEKKGEPAAEFTAEDAVAKKLTVDLVTGYLGRWGVRHFQMDLQNKVVIFDVLYQDQRFGFWMSIFGDSDDILVVSLRGFMGMQKDDPKLAGVLEILARENHDGLVGCWGWDSAKGEISFYYTFLAAGGLSYKDFARVLDVMITGALRVKKEIEALTAPPKKEEVAPVTAPVSPAPAASEKPATPAPPPPPVPATTEKSATPVPTEKSAGQAPSEKSATPVPTEKSAGQAPSEKSTTPVPTEKSAAPAQVQ